MITQLNKDVLNGSGSSFNVISRELDQVKKDMLSELREILAEIEQTF